MKVFISGNRSIKDLSEEIIERITTELHKLGAKEILVGDADGVDSLIQSIMDPNRTTVYHSQYGPRNNISGARTRMVRSHGSGRAFHTCKDVLMASHCDGHIGIVNSLSPSGTMTNHKTVMDLDKPSILMVVE